MKISLQNRGDAIQVFLDMIRPLKPFYSEHHAFLHLGDTGVHYGEKSAEMEGFARILWGLGPLWSADNTNLPLAVQEEISDWLTLYRDGIVHGTSPEDKEYWGDIFDYDQKMVEVSAISFSIALNRKELWDPLTENEKRNLYNWLDGMNQHEMPDNNWRYFRIMTNMMFRLLGLPWSKERMEEDFDLIDSFYIDEGWYCDGTPTQIDYYVAFAIHHYGLIYSKLMYEIDPERCNVLKERSKKFFYDFVYWFSNNGEEIPFGRSLTYRFAHSAPFAAMAYADLDLDYGVLKNLVLRNLESWMKRPIFDKAGVLTIGYGYPNLFMSENYNGCGSPYWCNKVFLILALHEDHPFWKAQPKQFQYKPKKNLKYPHMIVTHDKYDHALAYVTGQYLQGDHGQGRAKYEKFVYSNQLGFSIQRGTTLEEGGFDSTLAVSVKGENRYCVRHALDEFYVDEEKVYSKYHLITGVSVESTIIPCLSWHVRIHKIYNEIPIDIAEGGFSLPQERCFQVAKGNTTGRFDPDDVTINGNTLVAGFPWGTSCIASETGLTPVLIYSMPNTNLFYNLTVIPMVCATLEPGVHLIVDSVCGDIHEEKEKLLAKKPRVEITDECINIGYEEKELSVKTGSSN